MLLKTLSWILHLIRPYTHQKLPALLQPISSDDDDENGQVQANSIQNFNFIKKIIFINYLLDFYVFFPSLKKY